MPKCMHMPDGSDYLNDLSHLVDLVHERIQSQCLQSYHHIRDLFTHPAINLVLLGTRQHDTESHGPGSTHNHGPASPSALASSTPHSKLRKRKVRSCL